MDEVTVEPEDGDTVLWGHTISDMQADVEVEGDAITGALFCVSEGALPANWGPGYFLALKFDDFDAAATSVKVGLDPSKPVSRAHREGAGAPRTAHDIGSGHLARDGTQRSALGERDSCRWHWTTTKTRCSR